MAKVMLHSEKVIDDSDLKSNLRRSSELSDLQHLRKLLFGSKYHELLELQREFSDHSQTSQKISEVISEAIALRTKQDNSLTYALAPSVEEAIHASVKRNPKRLANALFPVIGPAIRESVAEMISSMMQQVNQLLENSLSLRSIKWRINAYRTNRTFAEVMLSETVLYQVEQVFLIHRESSLLINHLTSDRAVIKDPDMVSGMLTVVTDFVKDSFVVDTQQNIISIKFGQLDLLFEAGPYAILVAAVRGITPPNIQIRMREQIEELHRLYSMQLEAYDGNSEHFPDTYAQLNKCLLSKAKEDLDRNDFKKDFPWAAIIVLVLLLGLPIAFFIAQKIEQSKWEKIIQELQAEPGLVILSHEKQGGEYLVKGLRDFLSREPHEISNELQIFDHPISWQWQSYISNETEIVKQRIRSVIDPPASIKIGYEQGLLRLSGQADSSWVSAMSTKLPFIWGVQEVDLTGIRSDMNIDQQIQQLIGSLEAIVLEYPPNADQLEPNQYKKLSEVTYLISELNKLAEMQKIKIKIGILGFADQTGKTSSNNKLSEVRARNVNDTLVQFGIAENLLLAKGLGEYATQIKVDIPSTCTSHRCVVFEAYPN